MAKKFVTVIIPQMVIRVPVKYVQAETGPQNLTMREREIFELMMQGKARKEIASALSISVGTVAFHLATIYRKARVHGGKELVAAIRN